MIRQAPAHFLVINMWQSPYLLLFWGCVSHVSHASKRSSLWTELNLPEEHIPYFFTNNPEIREQCRQDPKCPFHAFVDMKKCWGYEKQCLEEDRMVNPTCTEDPSRLKAWNTYYPKAKSLKEIFWSQADFGYVSGRINDMNSYCTPEQPGDSSLVCSQYLRYCKASNLYLDLRHFKPEESRDRYRQDLIQAGHVGGKCIVDKKMLARQGDHKSPLQSWFAELEHFTSLDWQPIPSRNCDVVIDKPTILMKLDAGVNMYHHFCDFLNLYLSQHLNNSFSTDVTLINWDTSAMHYGDLFSTVWPVFSEYPVKYLREYAGKRICFKDAMFPLLPRMRFGLFYNTPIMEGCNGTAAFRAFSQHVLHRLRIKQHGPLRDKIRVTLLARNTKYRNILNQDEIVAALKSVKEYEVRVEEYNTKYHFLDQLTSTHSSDIFMGMHGSGLTHMLFQPDWGAGFEIYNCDDEHCYKDLARLRGVRYFTWENMDLLEQEDEGHHPTLGAHKKFTNYSFNVKEFLRIVKDMAEHVRNHPAYGAAWQNKYGTSQGTDAPVNAQTPSQKVEL